MSDDMSSEERGLWSGYEKLERERDDLSARAEKAEARVVTLEAENTRLKTDLYHEERSADEVNMAWETERARAEKAEANLARKRDEADTFIRSLHVAGVKLQEAEAALAAERARWGELRALYERERDYWNGPDVGYAPAVNPAAQAKRAQEILDAMDALFFPANPDLVVERCRLYMADFMPDDDGDPCLGIRGQFKSVAMNDECWLVRQKGAREGQGGER